MSDLLPCPFCGGPVAVQGWRGAGAWGFGCEDSEATAFTVSCEPCKLSIASETKAAALAAWNRRHLERLTCERCGKDLRVYGPPGNPNMEVCAKCHWDLAQPSWVPVSERLPEAGQSVLISHIEGRWVGEAAYSADGFSEPLFQAPLGDPRHGSHAALPEPTHWMPLPAPPKED